MQLNDLEGKFNLVSQLLAARPTADEALSRFQQLMDKDYIEYTKIDDALPEEAEALLELQDIRSSLETFIHNKDVYSKNAIALAGGFSSGKSTFCNKIFCTRDILLPVSINAETAIPAYVISGNKAPNAFGLTVGGGIVELGVDSYQQMNHDFLKSFGFNLKDLMPSVVIHAKMPKEYEHICFIDTPGYNSSATKDSFTNRDYETSLMFIKQAKVLFWFVGLDGNGTLINSDVKFLQDVLDTAPDKKIVVICNRADERAEEDLEDILDHFTDILEDNDIPYEGVIAYSAKKHKEYGYRKKNLDTIISELNCQNTDKKKELQKRLKKLFNRHINADANRIQATTEKIKTLNQILLHFKSLMDNVESKFSREAAEARREAIRRGGKAEKKDEIGAESIALITKNISRLKADLEKDVEKYKTNKDTISTIASKMEEVVKEIFKDFEDSADDAYVNIPAGTFTMGSDNGPRDSKPAHSVSVDSFNMKITLVTQAEWKSVMGKESPSKFKGDLLPVHNVSFADATEYCNKLSKMEGLKACYGKNGSCDFSANGYRLPTEAEWEYAASSFAEKPLQNCAWYKGNSSETIQPVARKEENDFGLYDMLGNVYEWTNDYWDDYSKDSLQNPHGPSSGDERVIRGGSFKSSENSCTVYARNMAEEDDASQPIGFRVVKKG